MRSTEKRQFFDIFSNISDREDYCLHTNQFYPAPTSNSNILSLPSSTKASFSKETGLGQKSSSNKYRHQASLSPISVLVNPMPNGPVYPVQMLMETYLLLVAAMQCAWTPSIKWFTFSEDGMGRKVWMTFGCTTSMKTSGSS